jgi:hypothetical protein
MEQVYLFFVANKDIKNAKKIDPFRIKTFVFFVPLYKTLKNKRDSYRWRCSKIDRQTNCGACETPTQSCDVSRQNTRKSERGIVGKKHNNFVKIVWLKLRVIGKLDTKNPTMFQKIMIPSRLRK